MQDFKTAIVNAKVWKEICEQKKTEKSYIKEQKYYVCMNAKMKQKKSNEDERKKMKFKLNDWKYC